jgi:hypothetical protein
VSSLGRKEPLHTEHISIVTASGRGMTNKEQAQRKTTQFRCGDAEMTV